LKYWEECISDAMQDAGISATLEQIKQVAESVEGAHDNYSMAYPTPENPLGPENKRLKEALQKEKEKRGCPECGGNGVLTEYWMDRSSTSQCSKCRGEGKI